MAWSALAVANCFLDLGDRDGIALTPMKLIELVYITHGWHLALLDEPLMNETAEAWHYGPVINSLYHAIKQYGSSPVTEPIRDRRGRLFELPPDATAAQELITAVWQRYGGYTALQLSAMTHQAGTPWYHIRQGMGETPSRGVPIPDEELRKDYREWLPAA